MFAAMLIALPIACSPAAQQSNTITAHEDKRSTDRMVSEALNGSGGADYPKAIAALEGSGRPADVIDLQAGDLILSAYRDGPPAKMPTESAAKGVERLERAALSGGEGAATAPQHLQIWFERGAGQALPANPTLAACWASVAAQREKAESCVNQRKR